MLGEVPVFESDKGIGADESRDGKIGKTDVWRGQWKVAARRQCMFSAGLVMAGKGAGAGGRKKELTGTTYVPRQIHKFGEI